MKEMKKTLLALAVLGTFAGVASAQSSVTIYGLIDVGISRGNGGTAGNSNGGNANGLKAWSVNQAAGSRLGLRGSEDLGNGMSAQFQIEHRFRADSGSQQDDKRFWGGRSYVQLSSEVAGRIYLGREYSPVHWVADKSDPFGGSGVGQLGAAAWGNRAATAGSGYLSLDPNGNGTRTANTVGYKSPSWGGLTFQAALGAAETYGLGRTQALNVEYAGGPLYAGLGFESVSKGTFKGQGLFNLAVHYDFGFAKFMVYGAQAKVGTDGASKTKIFSLGAQVPVGPAGSKFKALVYRVDPKGDSNNETKVGLGYDLALSKRTNIYADVGLTRADKLTNNNTFAVGAKHTF
jgi:predicted porin